MKHNFVAKHDFNRASTHTDRTKYSRLQSGNDLYGYWEEYCDAVSPDIDIEMSEQEQANE